MKKIVLFAAAGLMSLAACQEKAGYIIKGTAEGVADGDTVFLQKQTEEGFEALDSLLTMFGSSFEVEKVQSLLEKVPAAFAENEEVKALKEHVETVAKTAVGKKFIDFTLNTPEGKPVKLSDFIAANNYTLIDFWASWCGPCRMEMPNVVAAYAKYKAKGFGIVGVSLDNDAESWKKAIKDLNITWPQMSDLKGWQCEGAALYGVRAIPATLLVSKDGTIVARDLRGEDLEAKLAELMK